LKRLYKTHYTKEQRAQRRKNINVDGEIGKGVDESVPSKENGQV